MAEKNDWPILTTYDQDHLGQIALPLGGIGTGTLSLGGRGDLRHWEIVNRPNKEFNLRYTFFALHTRDQAGQTTTKALEGRLQAPYEGPFGSPEKNAGLPRFRDCRFEAAYPLGQVCLADPTVPVDVRLRAFNPLVPGDVDASSIPTAVLQFVLTNRLDEPVSASVCGTLLNFIGTDGINGAVKQNKNQFRQADSRSSVAGLFMNSLGVDPSTEQWGTLALATTAREGISYRTSWAPYTWANALLDFWDDFSEDGTLQEREAADIDAPQGSLAVSVELAARQSRTLTFLIGWHFPNRQSWNLPATREGREFTDNSRDENCVQRVGNYYATQYDDAWDVVGRTADSLEELERRTVTFVRSFCDSDLPHAVKTGALNNLSTLRSQTCFRTEEGHLFGWEGCGQTMGWQVWEWGKRPLDLDGSCYGSCTHVWNYEQATAFLFGELASSMREVEFLHSTRDDGHMSFRVNLPLEQGTDFGLAAADGQMGCIMKMYRDWQLSGDDEFLRTLWPKVQKALEFCWLPGGWDADQDGVMEGCQHNTMDIEYYGPNPQIGTWYLGALRAGEEMARHLGDKTFAGKCRQLFVQGKTWIEEHLFNGEYYEQQVVVPEDMSAIYPGLRSHMGSENVRNMEMQLGAGCLVDQLVGQYMAHVCGLGYLLDRDQVRRALKSIMKYNFHGSFENHFNHMRSYALNDEAGLVMASFPRKQRPTKPFPYFNEVMTGFEYIAAIGMIYEGHLDDGLTCIEAIRSRYDGRKRNPFDEAECGHHYARAMASWGAVPALTGFHYSAITEEITFAAQEGVAFWSNGHAWGTCQQRKVFGGIELDLHVLHGVIKIKRVQLPGSGEVVFADDKAVGPDEHLKCVVSIPSITAHAPTDRPRKQELKTTAN